MATRNHLLDSEEVLHRDFILRAFRCGTKVNKRDEDKCEDTDQKYTYVSVYFSPRRLEKGDEYGVHAICIAAARLG